MTSADNTDGTPPNTAPGDDSEQAREIVSRGARRSRTLHAAALRGAEMIEVTAIDRGTGALRDRMWTRRLKGAKQFLHRNREALFEAQLWAGPTTARRIFAALGEPDAYDSTYSRRRLYLLYQLASMTKRVAMVAPQEGTYAWRGVTLSFPRDASGRATIGGAVVILVVRSPVHPSEVPNGC